MGYAIALIIVGLLFAALHFFTELKAKEKMGIGIAMLVVVMFGVAFNAYNDSQRELMTSIELKFKQDKSVTCTTNNIEVSQKNFTFSIGTHTFIGKKGSPHAGLMIDVRECQ